MWGELMLWGVKGVEMDEEWSGLGGLWKFETKVYYSIHESVLLHIKLMHFKLLYFTLCFFIIIYFYFVPKELHTHNKGFQFNCAYSVKIFLNVKEYCRGYFVFLLIFLFKSSDKHRMLTVVAQPPLKPVWWIAVRSIDSKCGS